jgi:hypothetical protein
MNCFLLGLAHSLSAVSSSSPLLLLRKLFKTSNRFASSIGTGMLTWPDFRDNSSGESGFARQSCVRNWAIGEEGAIFNGIFSLAPWKRQLTFSLTYSLIRTCSSSKLTNVKYFIKNSSTDRIDAAKS